MDLDDPVPTAEAAEQVRRFIDRWGAEPARVAPEEALKHSAVFHCVRIISGALAQVQWRVAPERGEDAARVQRLLDTVHPRWTAPAWREWIGQNILLRGNAYVRIVRDGLGRPVRLEPWPWDRVEPVSRGIGQPLRYRFGGRGLDSADVLDFCNFGWDGTRSPSVLSAGARGAVAISRDLERYTSLFFKRGSLHRFIVQMKRWQPDSEWKKFKRRWVRGSRGVDGSDEPLFVPEGMDVTPVSLTNTDAELLQNRDFQITDVLRAFGVPSALANQESKNTSFGSGLAALLHGFARYTLAPHVRRIEAEANAKLAPSNGGWRIELDMSDLLRATLREQLDAMRVALGGSSGSGILTPNEAREFLGYSRLDDPAADELTVFGPRRPKDSA